MTDQEILGVVEYFRTNTIGCESPKQMCFTICYPLSEYLNNVSIENTVTGDIAILNKEEFALGLGGSICHFWLTLKGGNIIDPTVSQFDEIPNMPLIYFGEKLEWHEKRDVNIGEYYKHWLDRFSPVYPLPNPFTAEEKLKFLSISIKASTLLVNDFSVHKLAFSQKSYVFDINERYNMLTDVERKALLSYLPGGCLEKFISGANEIIALHS